MKVSWRSDPCYSRYGVNGSLCSFLVYLSEVSSFKPSHHTVTPADKDLATYVLNSSLSVCGANR